MSRYIPDDIKGKIWRRDGGRCKVCGSNKDLEYDHIIPLSKGGATTFNNLQLLCKKHNRQKKDFIDAGFIMTKTIDQFNHDISKNKYIFQNGYVVNKINPKKIEYIKSFGYDLKDLKILERWDELFKKDWMACSICGRWYSKDHNWIGAECSEECYWDGVISHFEQYNLDLLESANRVLSKIKDYKILEQEREYIDGKEQFSWKREIEKHEKMEAKK